MEVDDTAADPHITLLDRQRLLGQAMDHHVMTWFGAFMGTLSFPQESDLTPAVTPSANVGGREKEKS